MQVTNDEAGLRGCWFPAVVQQTERTHVLVAYENLDDEETGDTLREWFPVPGVNGGVPDFASNFKIHSAPGYMLRPQPPEEVSNPSLGEMIPGMGTLWQCLTGYVYWSAPTCSHIHSELHVPQVVKGPILNMHGGVAQVIDRGKVWNVGDKIDVYLDAGWWEAKVVAKLNDGTSFKAQVGLAEHEVDIGNTRSRLTWISDSSIEWAPCSTEGAYTPGAHTPGDKATSTHLS